MKGFVMNQKQRNYIVGELKLARDKKVSLINQTSKFGQAEFEAIIKAIKDGSIEQGEGVDTPRNLSVKDMLTDDKMILLVKRSLGHINSMGVFYIKRGNFIRAIKEISADSWTVTAGYRSGYKYVLDEIMAEVKTAKSLKDVIGDSNKEKAARLDKLDEAYKSAERKTMLADSEEMIEAISNFEALTF